MMNKDLKKNYKESMKERAEKQTKWERALEGVSGTTPRRTSQRKEQKK